MEGGYNPQGGPCVGSCTDRTWADGWEVEDRGGFIWREGGVGCAGAASQAGMHP